MKKNLLKKISILLLSIIFTISLVGCSQGSKGSTSDNSQQTEKKKRTFGVTFMTTNNPFFVALNEGLKTEIEKNGDKLITLDSQFDQNKQIADVEDLIQQKVDVIFVNPVDWKGIKPALEEAKKAGIPVISVDAPVFDVELVATQVASDNVEAGKQCAKALAKSLNEKGNIALLDYQLVKSTRDRMNGFNEVIKQYPNIKIVAKQELSSCSLDAAMPVMESILQAHPDIQGVFSICDPAGLGARATLQSANKNIPIVSVDGSKEVKEMIKDGKYLGTAAQFPKEIGKQAIQAAYKVLNKQSISKEIKVKVEFVDKTNLSKFKD